MSIMRGRSLGELLILEGLCPQNAYNVELHIPATGAIFVRYDVFFDVKNIPALQRVLTVFAAERQEGAADG